MFYVKCCFVLSCFVLSCFVLSCFVFFVLCLFIVKLMLDLDSVRHEKEKFRLLMCAIGLS